MVMLLRDFGAYGIIFVTMPICSLFINKLAGYPSRTMEKSKGVNTHSHNIIP
jgi:hypothetical protein